ncbi:MAG: phosphatidylserine decarboxylase [Bdellovibrionota bacterium]
MRLFLQILSPIYNRLVKIFAYGPWGYFAHRVFIFSFRKLYGIEDLPRPEHRKLGDFFLRDKKFQCSHVELVSPVQCRVMEGPEKISDQKAVRVKKIDYSWKNFPELAGRDLNEFYFWNFYLAPYHYHWVHSPLAANQTEAIRIPGASYPVNALGRFAVKHLYLENERLSFRWNHENLGKVYMLCVGAMGVSGLESCIGEVRENEWARFDKPIAKGQKLAGFKLGSSVLLLMEKKKDFQALPREIFVGHPLLKA